MKSKGVIVVFSSGVYLAGNYNAFKTVYLPPPHLFLPGVQFCIQNKLKSEIFKDKRSEQWGMGWGGKFSELRGNGVWLKKRGCSLFLILEDRMHAMTLPNQLTPK